MVVFVLVSFLAGLRGEETLKIVLGETKEKNCKIYFKSLLFVSLNRETEVD